MFDRSTYIKSGIWRDNKFLVNPNTAVKKCECCKRLWYSIEFCDHDGFADNKYPICNRCSRKKANKEKIDRIVAKYSIMAVCKKCEKEQSISHFISRSSDWIEVNLRCDDCRSMPTSAIPI